MTKKIIIIAGIVIGLLIVTVAGFFYWREISAPLPFARTQAGLAFEELLPKDTVFAMSFNPSNSEERVDFKKLWDTVLQDKSDALIPLIAQKLALTNNVQFSLEDLQGFWGENFSFAVGLAKKEKRPDFYFLFSIGNQEQAQATLEKFKNIAPQNIKVGIIKDIAYVTNAGDIPSRGSAFKNSSLFKKSYRQFASPISGYFFADVEAQNLFTDFFGKEIQDELKIIEGSAVTFKTHEEGGLVFDITTYGNKKNLAKSDAKVLFEPFTAYLHEKVPANNFMLFTESHGLGGILKYELAFFESAFGMKKAEVLEKFNYEKDLAPFLNKAFVMAIQDNGTLIPSLSLYIDASDAPEKASAVAANLDAKVPGLISLINLALPTTDGSPIIEKVNFSELSTVGGIVKLYINRIPESAAKVPLFKLFAEPVEISYGMTSDNILFFSTLPQFEKAFASKIGRLTSRSLFDPSKSKLEIESGNFVVVDAGPIANYANRIVESARVQKSFDEDDEKAFEILKKYLGKIKGFFEVSHGDGVNIKGKAILVIARSVATKQSRSD